MLKRQPNTQHRNMAASVSGSPIFRGCRFSAGYRAATFVKGGAVMRLFKPSYRDKKGKTKAVSKWWVELRDHHRIVRRFPGFTDKAQTQLAGAKIEKLVVCRSNREPPGRELSEWLEQIPVKLRERLGKVGILEPGRAAAGKPLAEHLDDFERSLLAKNDTLRHSRQTVNRVRSIIAGCEFHVWSDMSAERLEYYLKARRDAGPKFSTRTSDFYLKAARQFCNWMIDNGRAITNPLAKAHTVHDGTDRRHEHCPLTLDEFRALWNKTVNSERMRYGATGVQRALLYLLAVESGLRANELRNLTVGDFDLKENTVTVRNTSAKNRREAVLPVRPATAAMLREAFSGKLQSARAFIVPDKVVLMLRADLEAAGIPYEAGDNSFRDFHGLRHTTATMLAAEGVHPSVAQKLLRHSDIRLTMNIYTHTLHQQQSDAVAKLPDLTLPCNEKQKAKRGGA